MSLAIRSSEYPKYLIKKLTEMDTTATIALYSGEFEKSEKLFRKMLRSVEEAQEEMRISYHKGYPLHNIGLSQLGRGKLEQGVNSFALAYIEDTLSESTGEEDEADRSPAARVLRDGFIIRMKAFSSMKSAARSTKTDAIAENNYRLVSDPNPILSKAAAEMNLGTISLLSLCQNKKIAFEPTSVGLLAPPEKRVFIGGNYDTHSMMIPVIKEAVLKKGYFPVILYELAIPRKETHHYSLMLLHTCKYAIFEITSYSGQLMELERARDYDIKVLCVRSTLDKRQLKDRVSEMIKTCNFKIKAYQKNEELQQIVKRFLD